MSKIRQLWVETHRPKTINDVVFQSEQQKNKFRSFIQSGEIPHLLLVGVQGSGKTTISRALIHGLNVDPMDVMTINASKENSIDTMRDKISNFCQTYSNGPFKVVQLEEADGLSRQAQEALRVIMEEHSDYCRFIATGNYENKIIPAIRSRFQTFQFKAPAYEDVAVLVAEMLIKERVDFDPDLLEKYIASTYPDIRKLINVLNQNSVDGNLQEPDDTSSSGDFKFEILGLLEAGKLREIRKLVCENAGREDYEDLYRFMYDHIHSCKGFDEAKTEGGIVLIASALYKHASFADPEINFAALCIELGKL